MVKNSVLALATLMVTGGASAMEEQPTSSLGFFLQSLTSLYVTSQRCRQIDYVHTEGYVELIHGYVSHYYKDTDTPYWVLPVVKDRFKSRSACISTLQEGLSDYEAASEQFATDYPNEPEPPHMPDIYSAVTYSPDYRVTSPVLTK